MSNEQNKNLFSIERKLEMYFWCAIEGWEIWGQQKNNTRYLQGGLWTRHLGRSGEPLRQIRNRQIKKETSYVINWKGRKKKENKYGNYEKRDLFIWNGMHGTVQRPWQLGSDNCNFLQLQNICFNKEFGGFSFET